MKEDQKPAEESTRQIGALLSGFASREQTLAGLRFQRPERKKVEIVGEKLCEAREAFDSMWFTRTMGMADNLWTLNCGLRALGRGLEARSESVTPMANKVIEVCHILRDRPYGERQDLRFESDGRPFTRTIGFHRSEFGQIRQEFFSLRHRPHYDLVVSVYEEALAVFENMFLFPYMAQKVWNILFEFDAVIAELDGNGPSLCDKVTNVVALFSGIRDKAAA